MHPLISLNSPSIESIFHYCTIKHISPPKFIINYITFLFRIIYKSYHIKTNIMKYNIKTIYLAGGCFWEVEAYISRLNGVIQTETGYAKWYNP